MRIRIQTTNIYTFNRTPRASLRTTLKRAKIGQPDSIGVQEGGRSLFRGLRNFKGYKTLYKRSKNHHRRDNVILVKKSERHEVLGKKWFKTAPGAGTKWTPERNVFVVFYRKGPVKIAHISTHFHVVPEETLARQEVSSYNKAGAQYMEHVRFVRKLMNQYKREGYVVFVTADGNTRPRAGQQDWKYAAYNYLARGKWVVRRHGVDLIVHDSELVKVIDFETVDKRFLGQADHDTLIAEYEMRD